MRIGIILSQPPGYSETFFRSKILGLQENGVEVRLFCQNKNDDFTLCPVVVSPRVSMNPFLQLWFFIKEFVFLLPYVSTVIRYVKLERAEGTGWKQVFKKLYLNAHLLKAKLDWLHFGFATMALGSETVAKAIGAKMAVSFRGFDINVYPLKHPNCYQLLWKQVDRVHTISSYLLEKAYDLGLQKSVPYQLITPAVNLKEMPQRENTDRLKTFKIVTVARLNWIKGIDYLIEVAACLKQTHINFEWQVIGSGSDFEKERYIYHIYEKGLEKQVILKGKCSHRETLKMLSEADVYVQTSVNEGFCNAVLEAQAIGVPCIAFKVGGLSENIQDNKTGWLIEPFEVGAMAKTIVDVSVMDTKSATIIFEQSIKRVQNYFSLEQQKTKFNKFYT